MRHTRLVLAWLLVAESALGAELDHARLVAVARDLFNLSIDGTVESERAAFLVVGPLGEYESVVWPRTHERRAATWRGPVPAGTIAVLHTHPMTMPEPSRNDVAHAIQTRLSFVIVSRSRVYVVEPNGSVRLIASNGWRKREAGR